ncbi:ABC transporter substrate-binding protein [Dactylosporangium sucinum]|uniref:ABC transporter substrate-binding protein n=1 Tax=Dactylosporangium sucinum TaxID=1424081 RepID=A0A917X6L1_9ACTN|nr:ABC transporter substrate-binding protein [Dactylosporangium sucinum]GGM81345.1 ABC transporter substrate-binding protein [Dactylosporangium sucinum]
MMFPRTRLLVTAGAVAALLALTGCSGGSSDTDSSADSGSGSVGLQLNWIQNSTWAGSYLADEKGYYGKAGLKVDIMTGGPNVDFMAALSSGKALVAFAGLTEPATLNQQGGDYRVVATMYQKNPLSVISKSGSGITTPKALEGKRMGVSTTAMSVWNQFAAVSGIDTKKVKIVPITTGPEALVAGDVDAYLGFSTEAPGQLAALGVSVDLFLLQDFGFGYYVDVYTVRQAALNDPKKRDEIKRLLKADLQGQLDMIADPDAAAQLTVNRYGKTLGLELSSEKSITTAASKLFYSPTTEAKGIGYMAGDELTLSMKTLNTILGTSLPLDGSGYVDMSLLNEIKAEDPSFGTLPPAKG